MTPRSARLAEVGGAVLGVDPPGALERARSER